MYAVIKTGGKQYRVKPGDMLVVEKLAGAPGDKVAFDQVLMVGEGAAVTVGAPIVAGASVSATLVETRKGEKIKIFKKIRRQGYRRTRGHRQSESVLRVTAVAGAGKSETWDGEVDLTPLADLTLRARNLMRRPEAAVAAEVTPPEVEVETVVEPKGKGKSPRVRAKVVEEAAPMVAEPVAAEAPAEAIAEAPAEPPAKAPKRAAKSRQSQPKGPTMRDVAKSGAPKPTKSVARGTTIHKTSPRGKG